MGQYTVKHQCDDLETVIPKRTCRVKPRIDICDQCRKDYIIYKSYYNCQTCEEFNKRRELIHVGDDFALVIMNGEIVRVQLDRVRDIQEA